MLLRLQRAPSRAQESLMGTMSDAVDAVYGRVLELLSGELLQIKSGKLYDSIQRSVTEEIGVVTGRVFSDGSVPYAHIQDVGGQTSPHEIIANEAKALRYSLGGVIKFTTVVHHPGSKVPGVQYMTTALADTLQMVREVVTLGTL